MPGADIQTDICHNDTTCAFMFGDADNRRSDQGIKITFGYSKQYRKDLKQLVWSLSVSSDSAFPLFQQAYSGNTADVDTYVQQWHHLINLLGKRDFLFVGDSKVASRENMAHIHGNDGYFIIPLPMYATYENAFSDALENHDREELNPYKNRISRGFEVPLVISHEDRDYPFRMIILFDHGLHHRKKRSLEQQLTKTKSAFDRSVSQAGYSPLVSNKPLSQLSVSEAMMAHKNQYKVEHTYRRSKSGYHLEPIYLHTPERIEAYLFLFKIALQVVVLIERAARKNGNY